MIRMVAGPFPSRVSLIRRSLSTHLVPMHKLVVSAAVMAVNIVALDAQQITVPAVFANTEGGSTVNVWRASANRVQCLYDSTNFTSQNTGQPILINRVQFRLAGGLATAIVTYPSVEIHLQNAAVDFVAPSATFAANRSAPLGTPNFSGPVTTLAVTSTTPNEYFINIPLTTPFAFTPEAGVDLLMEIVVTAAPTPLLGNTTSTGFLGAAHLCNSVRSPGSSVAPTGTISLFCPVARFGYTNAAGAAVNANYGAGCYDRAVSLYEQFASGANDLAGRTVTLTPNVQGGYTSATTLGATVVAPTVAGLALGDDVVSAVQALPFSFQFPGGSTTSIVIDSNGSIGLSGTVSSSTGGSGSAMLGLPSTRLVPSMQDLVPDGAINNANVFAQLDPSNPNVYLVTWRNVPCFGSSGAPVPTSTFQVALINNGTNDRVEFRFQSLANDSSSGGGVALTGFSRGSSAYDPGSSDLTAGPVSSRTEVQSLKLAAGSRPVINQSITFTTSRIPPTAAFSIYVLSAGQIPAGLDLGIIGALGCNAYVTLPEVLSNLQLGGPTAASVIAIPNSPPLVGQSFFSQAIAFDAAANAAGIIVSNAVSSLMGSL